MLKHHLIKLVLLSHLHRDPVYLILVTVFSAVRNYCSYNNNNSQWQPGCSTYSCSHPWTRNYGFYGKIISGKINLCNLGNQWTKPQYIK